MTDEAYKPTPYSDINAALDYFSTRSQAILGRQMVGMYLYGSLALGDFNPQTSDIDFIVVTQGEITDAGFAALQAMHDAFDHGGSPWAAKVEAAYIPQAALNHAAPTAAQYPQVEKGTRLFKAPLEIGWAFQRYSLRERGVVIMGPDPRGLMGPVDPADMRRAADAIAADWLNHSHGDPEWLAWVRESSAQAFIILTLCRMLYSLGTGSVASKPAAAHWAQQACGSRWAALIQRALAMPHDESQTSENEAAETLAFLQYTAEVISKSFH